MEGCALQSGFPLRPTRGRPRRRPPAHARDELAGEAPSLAVIFGSRAHTDKAVAVLDAVQRTVEAPALIGCVARAIVAGRQEVEDEPAVAV